MEASSNMNTEELKAFLDEKAIAYQNPLFIESDPIQIPHLFQKKEDIEISGFLTSVIAWGNRKSIIKNAYSMMERMDQDPFDFILNAKAHELDSLNGFVHRTFNATDFTNFVLNLQRIYRYHGGLEAQFSTTEIPLQERISRFKQLFFEENTTSRSTKHLPDPLRGSAAKRINMFLRWMVRTSATGVDFGLWKSLKSSELSCPLDVHSGNVARKLGLLTRNQNDAKALEELDLHLRHLDPLDPVKYDFALFGLGVFEKF